MYRLSRDLSKDPDTILDWKESKFYVWLAVSNDVQHDDLLAKGIITSAAVWEPKKLPDILDRKKPMTQDDIEAALDRAEKIKGMEFKEIV